MLSELMILMSWRITTTAMATTGTFYENISDIFFLLFSIYFYIWILVSPKGKAINPRNRRALLIGGLCLIILISVDCYSRIYGKWN
jgi:hypothetical protein